MGVEQDAAEGTAGLALRDLFPDAKDEVQAFEQFLVASFDLNPRRLRRLGVFLLAHATVDWWLIRSVEEATPIKAEIEDAIGRLKKAAAGTFRAHVNQARAKNLITPAAEEFLTELNRARDEFLHWGPDRNSFPVYLGYDVTTPTGLRVCLQDVMRFFQKSGILSEFKG